MNIHFFHISQNNPETLYDDNYISKEQIVITPTVEEKNKLINSNEKIIDLITTYKTMRTELNYKIDNDVFKPIIDNIIVHMDTPGMNLSAFSQYFMVHNLTYSIFSKLNYEEKYELLFYVLEAYIVKRHEMYKSHGYSNIVLQVLSDNYSHKRKGTVGQKKIENQIKKYANFSELNNLNDLEQYKYAYFIPDKNTSLFDAFLNHKNVSFNFSASRQGKIPDFVLKIKDHYFIIEHKNMKETGGGQDKQITEILDFINYSEENQNIHYVTYLDGIFSNKLFPQATAKTLVQYEEIITILEQNKSNYFVNTASFEELIKHYIK